MRHYLGLLLFILSRCFPVCLLWRHRFLVTNCYQRSQTRQLIRACLYVNMCARVCVCATNTGGYILSISLAKKTLTAIIVNACTQMHCTELSVDTYRHRIYNVDIEEITTGIAVKNGYRRYWWVSFGYKHCTNISQFTYQDGLSRVCVATNVLYWFYIYPRTRSILVQGANCGNT